jgi:hypothetical protein
MESTLLASEPTPATHAGSHDFDFFFGSWRVSNRRLVRRLAGCTEWETFEARQLVWPILDGLGNMDEFRAENWRPGYLGMTLRLFNPATQRWSIFWMDNRNVTLEPAVIGGWQGDTGIFTGSDVFAGQPITVRFIWQHLGPDAARWEQEFSPDEGLTWEKNWVMEFTRDGKKNPGQSSHRSA